MPWASRPYVAPGDVGTAALWNAHVDSINAAVQLFDETVAALDGNGSLAPSTSPTVLYLDGVGVANVNGCTVPSRTPWWMTIINLTSNIATLKHENTTETTPAKRFRLPADTDLPLNLGQGALFQYVSVPVGARWVAVTTG